MKRLRNVRQENFCKKIASGKTQTEAYQEAYPNASYPTAKARASELLNQEKIAGRITQILNEKGITLNSLIENGLKDLLKGEKEVLGSKNKIITLKDNSSKAEGLKIALKLHRVLDTKQEYQDNRQVNITLNTQDINRLEDIIKGIKGLRESEISDGEIV